MMERVRKNDPDFLVESIHTTPRLFEREPRAECLQTKMVLFVHHDPEIVVPTERERAEGRRPARPIDEFPAHEVPFQQQIPFGLGEIVDRPDRSSLQRI